MSYATISSRGATPVKMATVKVMGEVADDKSDAKEDSPADKKYDEWELSHAADTLSRAEEIKGDKHLMKHLKPHLKKKAKTYMSLADMRKKAVVLAKEGK